MERIWCIFVLMLCALPVQASIQIYYLHNDHLGTPRVVTDQAQEIVWKGHVKPFGEMEVEIEAITNHWRFPGQRFDIESRLHYNYFRDYDPSLGRYIQSDPIGLQGGLNTYAYVDSNPINFYDPDGLRKMGQPGVPDNGGPGKGTGDAFGAVQLGNLVVAATESGGLAVGAAVIPGFGVSVGVCRKPPPKNYCDASDGKPTQSALGGSVIMVGFSGDQPCVALGIGSPKFGNLTVTGQP